MFLEVRIDGAEFSYVRAVVGATRASSERHRVHLYFAAAGEKSTVRYCIPSLVLSLFPSAASVVSLPSAVVVFFLFAAKKNKKYAAKNDQLTAHNYRMPMQKGSFLSVRVKQRVVWHVS